MSRIAGRAVNGRVELAFEEYGPPGGVPLLLIAGFNVQRHFWPDRFCDELVRQGFSLVRFDNRDSGESSHLDYLRAPTMASIMMAPRRAARYRLAEMADDAVAVMDAHGWSRAHILGVSMGGMIAQTLAINHPEKVLSLTSISSTPSPRIGRPALAAGRIMAMRAGRNGEELADRMIRQFRIIGSPAYPLDEGWLRDYAHKAFARGYNPAGGRRQLAAVMASGSRTRDLSRVRVPTLVVHGSEDLLIRPWAGRATAAAVRDARFVLHSGMGHDLPSELWPTVAADVRELARSAA